MKQQNRIWWTALITASLFNGCEYNNIEQDEELAIEFTHREIEKDLLEEIQVNPEFERSPPIAGDIVIEVLELPLDSGENIRFSADFSATDLEKEFLAIQFDDEKLVLRDDGEGADIVAGDKIFSIYVEDDVKRLQREIERRNITNKMRSVSFKNRRLIVKKATFGDSPIALPKPAKGSEKLDEKKPILLPIADIAAPIDTDFQSKSLMITDLSVVEDPTRTFNPCTNTGNANGAWTFGMLMRQMASSGPNSIADDITVSNFARNWLNTWMTAQTVNGENLPARTIQTLISTWENLSGVGFGGTLEMSKAPFKLLAIVNRLDLRGNSGYGFSSAGEGRFIFSALNQNCQPLRFNVIFEYGINKTTCENVKAFAQEWSDLSDLDFSTGTSISSTFNTALENITNQFTLAGTAPSKPNQSSINQIRTNELTIGSPWELREFNLMVNGQLELVTVKQEPALKYNVADNNDGSPSDIQRLVDFINNSTTAILANNYTVPLTLPLSGTDLTPVPFLGGKAWDRTSSTFWDVPGTGITFPIINAEARHIFSLNTCSGCHGGETETDFRHVIPSSSAGATLSSFLTGIGSSVTDPAGRPLGGPEVRSFNDLLRRELDLNSLTSMVCRVGTFDDTTKGTSKVKALEEKVRFTPLRSTH